jgi:hypothetical protein
MPVIEREIQSGQALQVGEYKITPQARLLKIRFPGYHSGLFWNRPYAITVQTADGQEEILPVRDVTRVVIWSMLAGGLLGTLMILFMKRSR